MSIRLDLSTPHRIVAANSHYYKAPTEVLYIDRVMQLHDLVYLVDGGWAITENEIDYPLEKDDVLLLSAGRHHYTRLPSQPETRTMCIHVTCEQNDNADYGRCVQLPTLMHLQGSTQVKTYFEEIIETFWSDNPRKLEKMSALFDLIVCELADWEEAKNAKRPDIAAEVIRIVNATPHRLFKLGEVAEMLYVSGRTVENAMRRSTGMSFAEYQMSRKLDMVAMQLTIEPYVRLKEIAAAFGFCDEFHLSKAFKRKYGVSPRGYKQAIPEAPRLEAEEGGCADAAASGR
jgi:AraC-like DNA-binding protein